MRFKVPPERLRNRFRSLRRFGSRLEESQT
jgi:hypothetical protein